jgi:4-hydroxythreonine-4-phosphate dehydrogenase
MGEPAGIGGEITLAAWARLRAAGLPFFVIDDAERLQGLAGRLGLAVPVRRIGAPAEAAAVFSRALPVLHRPLASPVEPGVPSVANAAGVLASIRTAVEFAATGAAAAVVTNPIQKSVLHKAGFAHPGHTEFLGEIAGTGRAPVMMLASPELRVVPVTVHVSLKQAIAMLTTDLIVETALTTAEALRRDFAIAAPRLAIAGLNPHAGEDGAMGDEDRRIVAPAVARLAALGLDVSGPMPADTLFTARARAGYDVALGLYHDQALIPIKTLDVDGGVNVTLGLSIVRTSPDHGTALDIAGRGVADPGSLVAAVRMAADIAARRALPRRQSA